MSQKPRVLIAEDEADLRRLFSVALADQFDVVAVGDGVEAWEEIEARTPRVVVTDLNMPRMNGFELTEKIRAHEATRDVPVIILTGTTIGSDLPPGFWRLGTKADAFIEKPVSPDDLVQQIRAVLIRDVEPLPPGTGGYKVHPEFLTRGEAMRRLEPDEDPRPK